MYFHFFCRSLGSELPQFNFFLHKSLIKTLFLANKNSKNPVDPKSNIKKLNTPLLVSENPFAIRFNFNVSLLMSHKIPKTLSPILSLKLLNFGGNSLWGRDDIIKLLLLSRIVKWKLQFESISISSFDTNICLRRLT